MLGSSSNRDSPTYVPCVGGEKFILEPPRNEAIVILLQVRLASLKFLLNLHRLNPLPGDLGENLFYFLKLVIDGILNAFICP